MIKMNTIYDFFYVSPERSPKHEIGNPNCKAGWCGGTSRYPAKCTCGGLIHADYGDESWDGDYWLFEKCDNCGENYIFADY